MSRSPMAEHDLLSRLGLSDGASEDEVETAHNDLVAFLESAPSELREWARSQVAATDEAYALLSDRGAAIDERPAPTRAGASARVVAPSPSTPRAKARAVQTPFDQPPRQPFLRRIGPLGRIAIAATALAALLVGAYMVYASDLPTVPGLSGTPAPESTEAAIDTAVVAQLMQAIQANPNDVASLQQLANIYFEAGSFGVAADWETKVLEVDPNNVLAYLALGAAQHNLGNSADAEANWRKVIELNPADQNLLAEAHYDLGFMYFSANPPDVERAITEWQAVIDIAPNSEIAQTVMTHMPQLQGSNGSASPNASASPQPSASSAATPKPSATAGQ